MMKPSDVWNIAVGQKVQRVLHEKTATKNISKEMSKPDEEIVRLTIPVQHSPTQQWATTEDDVEEVWCNVKKVPSGSCDEIFDRQKRRRTTTTSESKSRSKVNSMGSDPGWYSEAQKAKKHGPKMVATQRAIQTNLAKTDRAKARAKVIVESEEVPQVESPEKGPQIVNRESDW